MMVPRVHLNGDTKDTLLRELRDAHDAVDAAIKKVQEITIHGRNYYPISQHAYTKARHEQDVRLRRLNDTLEELRYLWIFVSTGESGEKDVPR